MSSGEKDQPDEPQTDKPAQIPSEPPSESPSDAEGAEDDLDLELEEADDGERLKEGFTGQER